VFRKKTPAFPAGDGIELSAGLFIPERPATPPAITMAQAPRPMAMPAPTCRACPIPVKARLR
jgi:hypothetical protein